MFKHILRNTLKAKLRLGVHVSQPEGKAKHNPLIWPQSPGLHSEHYYPLMSVTAANKKPRAQEESYLITQAFPTQPRRTNLNYPEFIS